MLQCRDTLPVDVLSLQQVGLHKKSHNQPAAEKKKENSDTRLAFCGFQAVRKSILEQLTKTELASGNRKKNHNS